MGKNIINFENIQIGNGQPTFIIAEVGINHNGNFNTAKELIKSAKDSGADAVKLQTYITEKRVPKDHEVYQILKDCELTFKEQEDLFKFGRDMDILIFSTPFDDESVDFLQSIECPIFKIASFDTVNHKLLKKVGNTMKPIIMSTGMTSNEELIKARKSLGRDTNLSDSGLILLHCISSYPMEDNDANLNMISLLDDIHSGPVGYSDHSIGIDVPVLAIGKGAHVIEKHFTLDTNQKGPDHAMSADPNTLFALVSKIRWACSVLGENKMGIRETEKKSISFRRFQD
tara:strand:+ start:1963 stop:2820 length:858 start_codon:yes stop_codon:yes gene_type:complete